MSQQGQQLGSYRILRPLGRGGFATVYLGEHIHLRTRAAIKVLSGEYDREEDLQNFQQEAKTIASLRHRHIIRMLDFGVEKGVAFLVLEYAPFGSLRAQYGNKIVPLDAVVSYVQQIALALTYAHKVNLIHRDIKPENMLIDEEQKILLSDFGIALLAFSSRVTHSGSIGGSPAYMSPEQLQGRAVKNSDQYSLAVTVYEWLTGHWPFEGQPLEVISQHINVVPPPLRSLLPTIRPEVEAVVLRALEKDPAERYPTVLEFSKALYRVAGVQPRLASEEQFRLLPEKLRTQGRSRKTREFASIETIHQAPLFKEEETGLGGRTFSRRTLLIGGVSALVVGIGGIAIVRAASQGRGTLVQSVPPIQTSSTPGPTLNVGSPIVPTVRPTPKLAPTKASVPAPKPLPPTPAPTSVPPAPVPPPKPVSTPPGTLLFSLLTTATMFSVSWSSDGTKIAAGGADNMVHVWDAKNGTPLASYPHTQAVTYVSWSPDSTKIASACNDGTCRVWDTEGNSIVVYTAASGNNLHSVAWSPDGTMLASGGNDKVVRVWDLGGNTLATYTGHTTFVWGITWSPDGTRIASGSGDVNAAVQDDTVKIWYWKTSDKLLSYSGHASVVYYVAWSPDGTMVASGSDDTTVSVWNATTGQNIQTYYNHTNTVYGVAWSPSGTRLAAGSTDKTVVIWSMVPGVGAYTYTRHSGSVFGVAWSPDGTKIVSSSADNTVQIWQA